MYRMGMIPWSANPSTTATLKSQLSLDGPSNTGNCQVSWPVNNGLSHWRGWDASVVRSRDYPGQGGKTPISRSAVNYILCDQVEWIWTFVKCIKYVLLCPDPILKAPMATAKDYVLRQPLCSHLASCASYAFLFSSCTNITWPNNRLMVFREYPIVYAPPTTWDSS